MLYITPNIKGLICTAWIVFFQVSLLQGQDRWITEHAAPISTIDHRILPVQDNDLLRERHYHNDVRQPQIFAEPIIIDQSMDHGGTWESSVDGHLVWRQRITSPGAYSLNLGFKEFNLPSTAAMFIYDRHKTYVIGPISQKDNDTHGEWWSPVIPFDDIVIEVQIAPKQKEDLKVVVSNVNHDFSGFGAVISGSCNLDVVCGEEDGFPLTERYRDMINSVGAMIIQGSVVCTGSLMNNTRQDCRPFVLTAEHCGVNDQTAASVVIFWNFQNTQCRAPGSAASGGSGDGQILQFNSGASSISRFVQSDFSLPATEPYFNGWDRETERVDSAFSIHHPRGDEKRISFDFDSLTFNIAENFVRVADWDIGTTEGGSSGSPLYDKFGFVVGHLSAGAADEEDDYGMIKKSWIGGGTPDTRLRDWLDPDNTGITRLSGRACSNLAVFDDPRIAICATISPQGQSVQVFIEAIPGAGSSSSVLELLIEDEFGAAPLDLILDIFDQIPEESTLLLPIDNSSGLSFNIDFSWSSVAPSHQLEISRSPSFDVDLRQVDLRESTIMLGDFERTTTYFWRVRGINECGVGPWSSTSSFVSGAITCQSFNATDLPLVIGDDPIVISSTIDIDVDGVIGDVNVLDIQGKHTWLSDLTFSLVAPDGTRVVLAGTPCEDEDDFNVSFDDESENINIDCPLTTGLSYQPAGSLSALNGTSSLGPWTLEIEDAVSQDGGSLDAWTLELCLNQTNEKRIVITPSILEVCDKNPEPISADITLEGPWVSPTSPQVMAGSGMPIAANFDPLVDNVSGVLNIIETSQLLGINQVSLSYEDEGTRVDVLIPITHIIDVTQPLLMTPTDGAELVDILPTFEWSESTSQEGSYLILVSQDSTFQTGTIEEQINTPLWTPSENLLEDTEYFWQVTAQGNCTDLSSRVFSFSTDVGVAVIDPALKAIGVYPNPTEGELIISLEDTEISGRDVSLSIISIDGRILGQQSSLSDLASIDLSSFGQGVYLIRLESDSGVYVHRVLVF